MSAITNRRELMATIQQIVKMNEPDVNLYVKACELLGNAFTDTTGIACQVRLAVDMKALDELIKEAEGQEKS